LDEIYGYPLHKEVISRKSLVLDAGQLMYSMLLLSNTMAIHCICTPRE